MTLNNLIEKQKCRKGEITGTTKDGRFWMACDPVIIKDSGNGWDAPEITFSLHLRHFENGKIEAVVRLKSRCNRNNLSWDHDYSIPALLKCSSIEDVAVELKKGIKTMEGYDKDRGHPTELIKECFMEYFYKNLASSLTKLGVSKSRPSPDDVTDWHSVSLQSLQTA